MNIEKSDKIPGYLKFSVGDMTVHAWTPEADNKLIVTYWDALTVASTFNASGLQLPSINDAKNLINSGVLSIDSLRPTIVGPDWLICWTSDYGAIESFPDSHEFKLRQNASGLGQIAPIWFVETK